MTEMFRCDNKDALVSYLYGESESAERQAVEAHLLVCTACAAEVGALGVARTRLAEWTSPEAPTGFRVGGAPMGATGATVHPIETARTGRGPVLVSSDLRPAPGSGPWWSRPLPAWAQAAAAAAIFAAGLALGAARGAQTGPAPAALVQAPAGSAAPTAALTEEVAAIRRDLAALGTSIRPAAGPTPDSRDEMLVQVTRLIRESEARQQEELARRTVQLVRDFDLQRKADLMQVQQSIGQIQGTTGAEVRQHRDAIDELMRRVSQIGR
jgi:hypothetical protein